jgi:hypothetical protein
MKENEMTKNKELQFGLINAKQKTALMTEDSDRIIRVVASKQIRDRDNDLVYVGSNPKGKGIQINEFLKNPIVLQFHDAGSWAIGKVIEAAIGADESNVPQLEFAIEFADTEEGNKALYLYKNEFQKAVSIRFRMQEYVYNEAEKGFDIFTSNMFEVSAVPLPANQEALIMKAYENVQEYKLSEQAEKKLDVIRENLKAAGLTSKAGRLTKSIYDDLMKLKK